MRKEEQSKRRRAVRPKKIVLRTCMNYDYEAKENVHDIDPGKSMTVPDMNLTVSQLMDRHTRGIGLGVAEKEALYLPEGLEVKRPGDLTELIEYREELEAKAKELQGVIDAEIAANKEKAEAEAEAIQKSKEKKEEVVKEE